MNDQFRLLPSFRNVGQLLLLSTRPKSGTASVGVISNQRWLFLVAISSMRILFCFDSDKGELAGGLR